MKSIRVRLLIILLSLFLCMWVAFMLLSYFSARGDIEAVLDAELSQSARVLHALIQHEIEEEEEDPSGLQADLMGIGTKPRYQEKLAFQAWQHGRLLLRSPNAPDQRMAQAAGFSDAMLQGRSWRLFMLSDAARNYEIIVGDLHTGRDALIRRIFWQMLIPVSVVLPLLAWLLWTGIQGGLRPLRRVTQEIGARNPRSLESLQLTGVPTEVRPLVQALNDLLARLQQALDSERRFTANAAHELRTPLAGLKAQAQLALRAGDDPQRQHALEQIVRGVDRATHLVAQLLTLARVDPELANRDAEQVDLAQLCALVTAELMPLACERKLGLVLDADGRHAIRGYPQVLAILLRNLLDNALRYTPVGGNVRISLQTTLEHELLRVTDSGPGIPADQREQVFRRFYRLPDAAGNGCGLGLSIVQRIAELHLASVQLEAGPDGKGLMVTVTFPR